MFEKRTRNAFPAGNIFLLAAVILAILWFLQQKNKAQAAEPEPIEQVQDTVDGDKRHRDGY